MDAEERASTDGRMGKPQAARRVGAPTGRLAGTPREGCLPVSGSRGTGWQAPLGSPLTEGLGFRVYKP
jgi:hypothetical protein